MRLITYGCGNCFDLGKFEKIRNRDHVKPSGGLWASPMGSGYGWFEWCSDEQYGDLSTSFEFSILGNILTIGSFGDLALLQWRVPELGDQVVLSSLTFPDYEAMYRSGVDAIHLTVIGQRETRLTNPNLYGWDCECVLVMSPDIVT
jgi:hypothetical protein